MHLFSFFVERANVTADSLVDGMQSETRMSLIIVLVLYLENHVNFIINILYEQESPKFSYQL